MTGIPNPVFVRGLSRSGGTLMCTLLDAHGDIAMSYELYPNLLEVEGRLDLPLLARSMAREPKRQKLQALIPTKSLMTFIARCERGGLGTSDVARLMQRLLDEGRDFGTLEGRMRMVELCGLEKMAWLGKRRWGMKCNNHFDDYLSAFPKAQFLDMLRDGRDVLASQLNTGSFRNTPTDVARAWVNTHSRFESFMTSHPGQFRMVRYEDLTGEPETELRSICAFLGIAFDPAMLKHHEKDLTVFKTNHLSGERIASAIDTTKIGRWRRDLAPEQLAEFLESAGDGLGRFGYF